MTVLDVLNQALQNRRQDTNTNIQNQPQQGSWVQDLINAHADSQTGGRIKRTPIGFNFQRDTFDPSSYYTQLGQIKGISSAATQVVQTEAANKKAQEEAAAEAARQAQINEALKNINPNYTYSSDTGLNLSGTSHNYHLKNVHSDVASAANYLGSKFGIHTIYGYGPGSVPNSDHPKGLAIDLMINNIKGGHTTGNNMANYVISNYKDLNVKYVIWNRYIWTPRSGWKPYHGPSPHTDHVHVSFNS